MESVIDVGTTTGKELAYTQLIELVDGDRYNLMQQIVVITLCVWLGLLLIADGRPPATSTVSMATTTQCNGIESLNLVWQVPFKMENFVAGFRYRWNILLCVPTLSFFILNASWSPFHLILSSSDCRK